QRLEPALIALQRSARRFTQQYPKGQLQAMRAELFREHYPQEELPAEAPIVIAARGQEAHGALPWDGHNALQDLVNFLATHKVTNNAIGRLVTFAARHLGAGWDGAGLGIAARHDKLGPTTVNLGMARGEAHQASITLNIRLTPPHTVDSISEKLQRIGQEAGLQVDVDPASMNPLFVDEHDPLVIGLKRAYQMVTGQAATCAYIGGTTYAKAFPRMVAFGPLMPDEPMLAHQVDERVTLDSLVRNTAIYALALYFLAGV
ncbi:MAG: peptidase dimerization domain-containing protein, partial [Anaerolineae bacterium]